MELNEHTPSLSILSFKLLLKIIVKHPLKSLASLKSIEFCWIALFIVLECDKGMVYDNVLCCFACLNV
jgi:hypothetical protein